VHGCPWVKAGDQWQEDTSGIGRFQSDGCIRLRTEDIEELFSVIITKPSTVYLVKDFFDADLPGQNVVN
jgi:lipoprotein-anchoring transpeptidase ErfK/SrfK